MQNSGARWTRSDAETINKAKNATEKGFNPENGSVFIIFVKIYLHQYSLIKAKVSSVEVRDAMGRNEG